MPDKRWEAAQQIFHAAVGEPPLERERILAEACGVSVDRVRQMLRRTPHIKPIARAGIVRLFPPESIAQLRHALNAQDARRSAQGVDHVR